MGLGKIWGLGVDWGGKRSTNGGSDLDNWGRNAMTVAGMTLMWATGQRLPFGAGSYYNNDRVANAMRNAWRVNQAREFFYKKYAGVTNLTGASVTNYSGKFGLEGLLRAGVDPVEQFIGSYNIDIQVVDNMLQFMLTNTTSFESFFYGIGPNWQGGPGGNFKQTYIFTEPLR
ncbi:hypothetical protein [Negadavirga shengliensis]|uniref:Uncharacterized protein n=1 Tax=Negadavirga shengliensis TaxID=1389218 RepID=A0ABV9T6F4_9BACT